MVIVNILLENYVSAALVCVVAVGIVILVIKHRKLRTTTPQIKWAIKEQPVIEVSRPMVDVSSVDTQQATELCIKARVERIKSATSRWLDAIVELDEKSLPTVLSLEEIASGLPQMEKRNDRRAINFLIKPHLAKCVTNADFDHVETALGIKFDEVILGDRKEAWLRCSESDCQCVARFWRLGKWGRGILESFGEKALEKAGEDEKEIDRVLRVFCIVYNDTDDDDEKEFCPIYLRAEKKIAEFRASREAEEFKTYDLKTILYRLRDLAYPSGQDSPLQRLKEPMMARAKELCGTMSIDELIRMVGERDTPQQTLPIEEVLHSKIEQIDNIDLLRDIETRYHRLLLGNCAQDSLEDRLKNLVSRYASSRRSALLKAL